MRQVLVGALVGAMPGLVLVALTISSIRGAETDPWRLRPAPDSNGSNFGSYCRPTTEEALAGGKNT